uniref:Ig-like domain-containing protein n=1 Tax=Sarcophilus harrisii TaxID=9305 RepID=A0A7N4P0Y7_SARHA
MAGIEAVHTGGVGNEMLSLGSSKWAKHFTLQFKAECYFENGTEHVRHVHRAIYNRQEYARFDSDLGKFVAVTELGRCSAEYWNSQKEILENVRAEVDTVCIYNYKSYNSFFLFSPAHPKVTVYPSKMAPPGHHNLLVCSVSGFYPGDIKVQWFLNGREETAGVTLVMLEMTHRRGDVYTCQVEHSSLQGPVHLDWKAQSESAQSKMLSGVGGLVLGLIFLGVGLIVHKRSQKGRKLQPLGLVASVKVRNASRGEDCHPCSHGASISFHNSCRG